MSKIAERHTDAGLVVLAVNAWNEDKEVLARFVEDKGLKQRVLLKGRDVAADYRVRGIPVTLWINAEGVIVDIETGFRDPEPLEEKTRRLLAGPA